MAKTVRFSEENLISTQDINRHKIENAHNERLPVGWVRKRSRSRPNQFYYFDVTTGTSSWTAPLNNEEVELEQMDDVHGPRKRQRKVGSTATSRTRQHSRGRVRILHILKKHCESRRPMSWRTNHQVPIVKTREEAIAEANRLLQTLRETNSDTSALISTFQTMALHESDDSSAKRMGDLGLLERNTMFPEFERAAYALDVHQLSGIVETPSGVHILLRLE